MANEIIKTVPISSSKKLELSINTDGMVVKIEGFINQERNFTHLFAYPKSEYDAVEEHKHDFTI